MIELQQGINQIYSNNPKSLYFLTGPEYGVKVKYLNQLQSHYSNQVECWSSILDLFEMFSKKSLFERIPKLYVVRYDKEFLKKLDSNHAFNVNSIIGTIVGIYEDDADEKKLDKWFPESVLRINKLSKPLCKKHLSSDFPKIPEILINCALNYYEDYYQLHNIFSSLSLLSTQQLGNLNTVEFTSIFINQLDANISNFKQAIAARDFSSAVGELDRFSGDYSSLFYDILNTYIEIMKCLDKKYSNSFVTPYLKLWSKSSIKSMYAVTYKTLEDVRSNSSYDPYNALIYVCGLLKYSIR